MTTAQDTTGLNSPRAVSQRAYAREKRLMARQRRVVFAIRAMAYGFSDSDISDMLRVSNSAFRNMLYHEMSHHGLTNRVQLTFHYIKYGFITGDDLRKRPTHGEGHQL